MQIPKFNKDGALKNNTDKFYFFVKNYSRKPMVFGGKICQIPVL